MSGVRHGSFKVVDWSVRVSGYRPVPSWGAGTCRGRGRRETPRGVVRTQEGEAPRGVVRTQEGGFPFLLPLPLLDVHGHRPLTNTLPLVSVAEYSPEGGPERASGGANLFEFKG